MTRRLLVVVVLVFACAATTYIALTIAGRHPATPAVTDRDPAAKPAPTTGRRVDQPAPAPRVEPTAPRRAPAVNTPPAASATAATAARSVGILNIETDVPGAQVFIDREFIGAAPIIGREIAPGSHRVNVSASGFEGVVETIDVVPGARDLMIKLREVRLDQSIDVIHKHRLGSCSGRLIATPLGVRYETADKDDAFTTALLNIETFEVDYLNKNLKLKIAKGKTYDFTDPDGDADRLFVFQRDVDHARDRLRKGDPAATK
jgi:hypothetical protein